MTPERDTPKTPPGSPGERPDERPHEGPHEEGREGAVSILAEARRHPGATIALALCIVAGMALSGLFMPESISLARRVAGGAVMGGLAWLTVMIGRVIGG